MTPILLYALKVVVCSTLLIAYYYLALRNKVFHQWNRFYLLLTLVLSFIIPLFQFTIWQTPTDTNPAIQLLQTINDSDEYVVEVSAATVPTIDWYVLARYIYAIISLILFGTLLQSLVRLYLIIRKHTVQEVEDIHFINTDVPGTPFSFLRYIFWNRAIDLESRTGKNILKHELVHVREWHTLDKLFMQLLLVVAWWNPVFWIIRYELRMIHEFIADNKTVQGRDAAELAAMILQAAYPSRFNHLINPFFHHSIKRRLHMLTKIQNPWVNYFSRVMMLPLLAFIVFLFSVRATGQTGAPHLEKKMVVVIDAGHGKKDGVYNGAKGGNMYEDEIVLAITQEIKRLNQDPNLEIRLTREDEEWVELKERVALTKTANADLFLSLHVNAMPGVTAANTISKKKGFEVYVSGKNQTFAAENNRLASALVQSLNGLNRGAPNLTTRQMGIWVLDQSPCPAVLLECGFITDAADRAYLSRSVNQTAIAQKILEGIALYASTDGNTTRPIRSTVTTYDLKLGNRVPGDTTRARELVLDKSSAQSIDIEGDKVTVTYSDGKKETVSIGDARKIGLLIDAMQENGTWEQRNAQHQTTGIINTSLRLRKDSTKPLVVIDGKLSDEAALKQLNPNQIQSINVLKGATAIAKYSEKGKDGVIEVTTKKSDDFLQTFSKVEQEARFPDENGGWRKFLETNLNAEVPAKKNAPAGMYTIIMKFIVEKDGTLTDITPETKLGYGMEEEMVRVMKLSPRWIPARQNGKIVRSYKKQPVTFVVSGGGDPELKSGATLTVAQLNTVPLEKLVRADSEYPVASGYVSTDLKNGDIIEAAYVQDKNNSVIHEFLKNAVPGKVLFIDKRLAMVDGKPKKLPAVIYYIK